MNKALLREYLKTNLIKNEQYLDLYLNLIFLNLSNKKQKGLTQAHHVIPRSFSKNIKVDEKLSNLTVNLIYKDHVLAHYYLYLGSNDNKFKLDMYNAIEHMIGWCKNNVGELESLNLDSYFKNLDNYLEIYEESIRLRGERTKRFLKDKSILTSPNGKRKWIPDDQVSFYLKNGWSKSLPKSVIEKQKITMQNKTWITDGILELLVSKDSIIPEGFKKGRLFHKQNMTEEGRSKKSNLLKLRMTGSKLSEETKKKISNTLKLGKNRTSTTKWITNGTINKRVQIRDLDKYILEGWYLGKSGKNKSCSTQRKKLIGEANKGRIYINNGIKVKFIKSNELDSYLDQGWIKGKLRKEN